VDCAQRTVGAHFGMLGGICGIPEDVTHLAVLQSITARFMDDLGEGWWVFSVINHVYTFLSKNNCTIQQELGNSCSASYTCVNWCD
jgi:hypothetical protein